MTTGEEILQRAVSHAEMGSSQDQAVDDLLRCCSGRRVSAVRARQGLLERLEADPGDDAASRALGFVDEMLGRDVWDVV